MSLDNPFNNRIHPTAIIYGDVKMGLGVKIGAYCVLIGDITIGDNTEIMPYTEIRDGAVIGKDCYIDSRVTVMNGCKIEDGSKIPSGKIVKDYRIL
jgi:UDP-N-acetylglucosamine acyltransferase